MSFGGSGRGPFDFDPSRVPRINVPRFSPRGVTAIVIGVLTILLLWNTIYQNQPDEAGVVLRFGRFTRVTEPGLHFLLPFIETVAKVPVERQLKAEFGFRTIEPGVGTSTPPRASSRSRSC
jgi:regulator of protease activity HflC (stomatin/prohibitin superfamily)